GRSGEWRRGRVVSAGEGDGAGVLGLVVGLPVVASPLVLLRWGEPGWQGWIPLALGTLTAMTLVWLWLRSRPATALGILRAWAAGLLVLVSLNAPTVLAHRESGRELFAPARAREVLVWGAWRTAWMAGYFYNDGRVREVATLDEVHRATAAGPVLLLCGPGERRQLEATPLRLQVLAEGPRSTTLLELTP